MTRILAHAHSIWSYDGSITLEEWVAIARERQCGAVLLTEHEESGWDPPRYREFVAACRSASTRDVRLIPGIEFNQDGYHILSYALSRFPPRPSTIQQLAEDVHAQGRWLCLAHPGKYRHRLPASLLQDLDAVEVWNSKWIYDGLLGPHPESVRMATGKARFVGQDVHKRKHLTPLYLVTASHHVAADLQAGRFHIEAGQKRWQPDKLPDWPWLTLLHWCRFTALRIVLACYRALRP